MRAAVIARCRTDNSGNAKVRSPFAARRAFVYDVAMKRMKSIEAIVVAFAAIASTSAAPAADERPTGGRIPTVTRLVKLFTEREATLADAVRAGDQKRAQEFLTDDFEMRIGTASANPIPRAEWLADVIRTRNPGEGVTGMAVHDLNGSAVASFTQGRGANAIFVVDVWRAAGSDWKLAIRYAAPAGTAAFSIPGAGAMPPEIPKKY